MTRIYDDRTRRILADPEKRHAWVIYELRVKGLTLADLARQAGVHRVVLYQVWQKRYPRMQSLVAGALDMLPQDLFPERYDEKGLPLKWLGGKKPRLTPDGKHTTRPRARNGKIRCKNYEKTKTQAAA